MRILTIDCSSVTSEAGFWTVYVQAVGAEAAEHFGRNLDALRDALCAGGPGWPGECELHFSNAHALRELHDGRFIGALRRIASRSNQLPSA